MRQLEQIWHERGVSIVIVTFEPDAVAQAYLRDLDWPWPVLLDPRRALYRGYAMDRASRRAIWSPASLWAYAKLMRRGRRPRTATGDVRQRGGDVLIDPAQQVRLHHVGVGPADRPSPRELLAVVDAATD